MAVHCMHYEFTFQLFLMYLVLCFFENGIKILFFNFSTLIEGIAKKWIQRA